MPTPTPTMPDFFAGVSAPAEDLNVGPLSPSAAFAHAASGGVLPTLLSGPNTMRGAGGGGANTISSVQGTPTMSSVQGKTRQFIVSEEVAPSPAGNGPPSSTSASNSSSVLDLLSDDINLDALAASNGPPSASQQYLNSIGAGAVMTGGGAGGAAPTSQGTPTVSYTHLTLPTT